MSKTAARARNGDCGPLRVECDETKIDAIFARLEGCHQPGATVGIAIDGRPIYRKGFGLANLELPVTLSPSIRMRIGSATKHFTCLAYLLLCEEGKAHLDDPIGKFLPELHPVSRDVSMRQLMGNTSGVRDAFDLIWQFSGEGRSLSSAEVLSYYREIADVNFPRGESWAYCNGGFLLLTAAIERISGQDLESVLYERVLAPTGMYASTLRRWDTDFLPDSATMHSQSPRGAYEKAYARTAMSGEGGLVSTVDDMLRWLAHMDDPHIGNSASWAAMRAPHVLPNGASTGYGFGLMQGRYHGVDVLYHAGSVTGGNSQMLKVPAARLDVIVMLNRRDIWGMRLAEQILDACIAGPQGADAPAHPAPAEGVFRSSKTGKVVELQGSTTALSWAPDGLQMAVIDGCPVSMTADAAGILWPTGMYEFVKTGLTLLGDRARPSSILCNDFGELDELMPVPPAGEEEARWAVGQYRSQSAGVDAQIFLSTHGLRLMTSNRFGSADYQLESLARHVWRATGLGEIPWGGILSFDHDQGGFYFSSALRTHRLPFQRVADR